MATTKKRKSKLTPIQPVYKALGRTVKKVREQAKLSQSQLADKVGVLRSQIANIENGGARIMLHQLVPIASALKTNVAKLLGARG